MQNPSIPGENMSRTAPPRPAQQKITYLFFPILLFALFALGCKEEAAPPMPQPIKPVKLFAIAAGSEELRVSLPGRVRAAKRSELSFKVSGPLEELPVIEGQLVKKGETIARILPRDFETSLAEARARELQAEQQYRRYKDLYTKRQASKADFDRFRASRDVARAKLEDARNALNDTNLVAPFDGVIAKKYVENFEKVQAKQPIVYLQQVDQLEVLVDVPELMMAQFREAPLIKVTTEFDAIAGKSYPLTVKEFSTAADPATQTYQVVLALAQPEEANILPGMTAKVTVTTEEEEAQPRIQIPAIAVLNDSDGNNYVWVFNKESRTVTKRIVELGKLAGTSNALVADGLVGGEEIVMAGVTQLAEGMEVRPWDKQREGK